MAFTSVTYTFSNGQTADADQVNTNFTNIINGLSDGTKDISISALTAAGVATLNGNVILGSDANDDLTFNGAVASDILTKTTATTNLGSTSKTFAALYLDKGATDGGAVYFNATSTSFIKSSADGLTLDHGGFTACTFAALITTTLATGFKVDSTVDAQIQTDSTSSFFDSSAITSIRTNGTTQAIGITAGQLVSVGTHTATSKLDVRASADGVTAVYALTSDDDTVSLLAENSNASCTSSGVIRSRTARANSTAFNLYSGQCNGGSDSVFRVRGDGTIFAESATVNTPGDYAEYFEWADGNQRDADRRGISVVLENGKIRRAVLGEEPIGVISATPVFLADAAENYWTGKNLTDHFGSKILEEYKIVQWIEIRETPKKAVPRKRDPETGEYLPPEMEIEKVLIQYQHDQIPEGVKVPDDAVTLTHDEKGNLLTRPKLNPKYDPNAPYIPRSERKEWDPVGLLGKICVLNDQVIGKNWVKLEAVNEKITRYLVK